MDAELNNLKASVNLVEYAASQGYLVDKAKSCRRTTVMRDDNDDKIVIYHQTKYWWYFSTRDESDKGTIVDFIQNRQGLNIGEIKKNLREWLGQPQPNLVEKKYKNLSTDKRDVEAVRRYINSTFRISNSSYLQSRHIDNNTIYGHRFGGTIKQDRRGNTVFLHRNFDGYCGAELKNFNFTGCPKDSLKGIWHSRTYENDNRLVVCESGIDNLSYHILHGQDRDRHISTAGNLSPEQKEIVGRAIKKMPPGSTIVAAFDNDAAGRNYAEEVKNMVPNNMKYKRHTPKGKDWNVDLKALRANPNRIKKIEQPSMMRV